MDAPFCSDHLTHLNRKGGQGTVNSSMFSLKTSANLMSKFGSDDFPFPGDAFSGSMEKSSGVKKKRLVLYILCALVLLILVVYHHGNPSYPPQSYPPQK